MEKTCIMDPEYERSIVHGGKITCHKCGAFLIKGEDWFEYVPEYPGVYFHIACFNRYEHYYGLNRPID